MTSQEIVREILTLPIFEQFEVIEKIQFNLKQNLKAQTAAKQKLSVKEKLAIVENLAGIGKPDGKPAPTDEEIKEDYTKYLAEKYK